MKKPQTPNSDETLVIDDEDRYSRLRLIAWWDQEKLARARVLVVGAGALGNEVLKNLALLGVGHVQVVDFDHIETSNLTRSVLFRDSDLGRAKADVAAQAASEMNPDVHVVGRCENIITDVGLGIFRDADVVIGCLDNREARLWVNRCCWKVGTPWVDGGIQEINGVAKVFAPPHGACYECAMTENDYRLISLRYSCPLLKQEDIAAGKVPTAPTIASIVGGLQVQEALKLIHDIPAAAGQAMVFNGLANQFYTTNFQRRADCLSHETYDDAIDLPLAASKNSAAELFDAAKSHLGDSSETITLELVRDLVVRLTCPACDTAQDVLKAAALVSMRDAVCPSCSETMRPELTHSIEQGSDLAQQPLAQLGIPALDIVHLTRGNVEGFFLLAGDHEEVGW